MPTAQSALHSTNASDPANAAAAQVVAERLREAIFAGDLGRGERLREVALSDSLAVSRRTVREALRLLAEQRLVSHERHRGAVVRTFTARDIQDLYTVRRTFELEGARNSPRASEEARSRLSATLAELGDALHANDSRRTVQCDLAFHGAVVGLAESDRLDGFYEQMSAEMEMVLVMIRGGEEERGMTAEQLVSEHRSIHDLLLERNVVEAQRAILAHIDEYERFVLALPTTPSNIGA